MNILMDKLIIFKKHMGKYSFLLMSFIFLFLVLPIVSDLLGSIVYHVFITFILIGSIYSIIQDKAYLIAGIILVLLSIAGNWLDWFKFDTLYASLFFLFQPIFLFYTAIIIIRNILDSEKVTDDLIKGSICAYLILGLAWGMLYIYLFAHVDNAFLTTRASLLPNDLIYFSFVTITTLGYGDITPNVPIAISLSILEAVVGLFYVTTVVARLVSIHLSQSLRKNTK